MFDLILMFLIFALTLCICWCMVSLFDMVTAGQEEVTLEFMAVKDINERLYK
jgi:hypothetical protein